MSLYHNDVNTPTLKPSFQGIITGFVLARGYPIRAWTEGISIGGAQD